MSINHFKTNAGLDIEEICPDQTNSSGPGRNPFYRCCIERAFELAKLNGAFITGVTVVDIKRLKQVGPVPPGGGAHAAKLRDKRLAVTEEQAEKAIEKFKQTAKEFNIAAKIERETGDPFESMIARSRYNDLTIFGLKSLFDYGFNFFIKSTPDFIYYS